jgi:hypothetical protein
MKLNNRAGFALPLAILLIAVLTVALAAAFSATRSEITSNTAQRSADRAFNIAQQGLETFLVRRTDALFCPRPTNCMDDPTDSLNSGVDSLVFPVPGGYAEVVARRVRPYLDKDNPALFFVRSHGVDTSKGGLSGAGGNTHAERTVGIYANWSTNVMNVMASWTSLSGITKTGTAGIVSGVDQCNGKDTVAGVSVPKGDLKINGQWQAYGDPPADTFKTVAQLEASVGIDWNAVRSGSAFDADFVVPPSAFPDVSWFANNPDAWPIIHVTGNFSLPNAGRGMLIVDNDLVISGSNMWDGVILVGGKLESNGFNTVAGATVSGLNKILGQQPDTSEVNSDNAGAMGTKDYVYSSCKVSMATKGLRRYRTLPNTWMDNVASW